MSTQSSLCMNSCYAPLMVVLSCTHGQSCRTALVLVSPGSLLLTSPLNSSLACGPGPWPLCSTECVGLVGLDGRSHDWCLPLCPAGTSSILAGAALAALQRAAGQAVGTEALIHAVLHLEQVLTTGTRWSRVVVSADIFHRPCRLGSSPSSDT